MNDGLRPRSGGHDEVQSWRASFFVGASVDSGINTEGLVAPIDDAFQVHLDVLWSLLVRA